jgi:GxxExxY protein
MENREDLERIAKLTVDAIYTVHRGLGPGLLESAYQACLSHELRKRDLGVRCEVILPVHYDGLVIDAGYRIDLIVEDAILIEHKAVQALAPIHQAQIITYLRLSGLKLGFLLNWNVPRIKDGIRRFVNHL